METTTTETTAKTAEAAANESRPGCFAILVRTDNGEVKEIYARTKKDLSKQIETHGTTYHLLGAFKGKKLKSVKRVSIKFN